MGFEAKVLCPFRLPARALITMAGFGFHDTHVTAGELFKARVTMALAKTLFGFAATMAAENQASKIESNGTSNT